MPEETVPVPSEDIAVSGENKILWLRQPVLRLQRGRRRFLGRVFVEVWDGDDERVVTSDPALRAPALAALQSNYKPILDPDVLLADRPTTGEVPKQTFIGRVIVEMWDDGALVGITGPETKVVERAIKSLQHD